MPASVRLLVAVGMDHVIWWIVIPICIVIPISLVLLLLEHRFGCVWEVLVEC